MTLMEKLPMLEGWKYQLDEQKGKVLAPQGSTKIVYKKDVKGYVRWAELGAFGNGAENTKITFQTDLWKTGSTIKKIYEAGLTERAQDFIPYCPLYDTTNDAYWVIYGFQPPAAYKNRIWATIKNQTENSIQIHTRILRISIEDIKKFKESYRELLTPLTSELEELKKLRK